MNLKCTVLHSDCVEQTFLKLLVFKITFVDMYGDD